MGHLSGLQKSAQNCSAFEEDLQSEISHILILSWHRKTPVSYIIRLKHFALP